MFEEKAQTGQLPCLCRCMDGRHAIDTLLVSSWQVEQPVVSVGSLLPEQAIPHSPNGPLAISQLAKAHLALRSTAASVRWSRPHGAAVPPVGLSILEQGTNRSSPSESRKAAPGCEVVHDGATVWASIVKTAINHFFFLFTISHGRVCRAS
jgi:hypothetical protein